MSIRLAALLGLALLLFGCGGGTQHSVSPPANNPSPQTPSYELSVTLAGNGGGTVSSNPNGIACNPACSGTFQQGADVTLSATAQPGSSFASWSGACSGSSQCVLTINSNATVTATFNKVAASLQSINHIIFTFQENRSFDHYFGRMGQYRATKGYDDVLDGLPPNTSLLDLGGNPISPYHVATMCIENVQPSWNASHVDWDNGKMDQFPLTGNYFGSSSLIDPNGDRALAYYDWNDLPYYYELAFQFATSDSWFSSMLGPTAPNRMYTFAATSLGFISDPTVPAGGFTNPTIFDRLDEAGVSWRYYYQNSSPGWITYWSVYYKDPAKFAPITQYFKDIANDATFPHIVFIENGGLDEHPGPSPGGTTSSQLADVQLGAAKMKNFINALMNSPSWANSVFILSYDEGGGFYDHVPPPAVVPPDNIAAKLLTGDQPGNFGVAGFRVPVIVISPWVKAHFVSHVPREHTSILKLIETRFGLQPLTARDAVADDMTEFFDFSAPSFSTPPSLPNQPTNGLCDITQELQ